MEKLRQGPSKSHFEEPDIRPLLRIRYTIFIYHGVIINQGNPLQSFDIHSPHFSSFRHIVTLSLPLVAYL